MKDYQTKVEREFMEGERDSFDYVLAEMLGMTVLELQERMSQREFIEWKAFVKYRNTMVEFEKEKAKGKR